MYEQSELDYLIYNATLENTDLILNSDPEKYLEAVTEYKPLDPQIPYGGEKYLSPPYFYSFAQISRI